jgi:hypothetical protein
MAEDEYKLAKEAFVTGHGGSSFAQIILNLSIVPVRTLSHPMTQSVSFNCWWVGVG